MQVEVSHRSVCKQLFNLYFELDPFGLCHTIWLTVWDLCCQIGMDVEVVLP